MSKYSLPNQNPNMNVTDSQSTSQRFERFKKKQDENGTKKEIQNAPLHRLLEKRDSKITDLKKYWLDKIGTDDHQLALVAIEILGMVVTSVASERSFSKGRSIITDFRTSISPDHAKDQMIIQCNREIAIRAMDRNDLFKKRK